MSLVSMEAPTMRTRKRKNRRSWRKGVAGKKRKPKPLRGAVKRKKTDGTKQSKSGANKGCQPSVERSRMQH
jgi:hypothetical protein